MRDEESIVVLKSRTSYYAANYPNVKPSADKLLLAIELYLAELSGSNGYDAWKTNYDNQVAAIEATFDADILAAKNKRDNAINAIPQFSYGTILVLNQKMNRSRFNFLKVVKEEAWRRYLAGEPEMVYVEPIEYTYSVSLLVPGGTNIYDQFTAFKWLPVNIIEKNNGLSTILEQNKQYFYDDKITFERDIHGMLLVKNSMSYLLELDITINLLINKKVHFDGTTVKNYEIKHGENFIVTYDIGKVLGLDNILSGNHAFEQDIFFDNYGEFSFFMEPKDSKNTVLIRNMTGSVQAFSLVILEGY